MMHFFSYLLYLSVAFISNFTYSTRLESTKKEILQQYDSLVEAALNNYLKIVQVSRNEFDKVLVHEETELQKAIDEQVKILIELYRKDLKELSAFQEVADKVFKEIDLGAVEVIHVPCTLCTVIYNYYEDKTYILLDVNEPIDMNMFAEILKHECCHVIYDDTLISRSMKRFSTIAPFYVSAKKDQEAGAVVYSIIDCDGNVMERETTAYLALCNVEKAMETRADVYAAIHSISHGQYLMEYFKQQKANDQGFDETHPTCDERIEVLNLVKSRLDDAQSYDQKLPLISKID